MTVDQSSSVRVGVGVFVYRARDDPRFCMGVRRGRLGAGTWSLPGGHLEFGESFEQCAAREVLEETGLHVEDVKFLTAVESVFEAEGKHYVTIFMVAVARSDDQGRATDPKTLEPDKCDGWDWKSFDEIQAWYLGHDAEHHLFKPIETLMMERSSLTEALCIGMSALQST